MHTGLTTPFNLGGFAVLSGWMPRYRAVLGNLKSHRHPIFIAIGDGDKAVNPEFSRLSDLYLTQAGFDVDYHVYPGMGHTVTPEEVEHVRKFISNIF